MSECSTDKKDCNCSSGACNPMGWVIVYELAIIIVMLLLLYSESEKKPTAGESDKESQ